METNIGKKVIIRGDRSGVEYGELVEHKGSEVTLHNARRIWYWEGAASLSQLAKDGTAKPLNCRFTVYVDSITILALLIGAAVALFIVITIDVYRQQGN